MIVVTISKWRQKFVWLLAAVLVSAVFLGQFLGGSEPNQEVNTSTTFLQQQEGSVVPTSIQDSGYLKGLIEKLKNYYRGE